MFRRLLMNYAKKIGDVCTLQATENPKNPLLRNGKGKLALDKLSCKTATSFFVNKKFVVPTAKKWLKKAGLDEQTIRQIYKLPLNVTNNASLSNFQFKIVHYILPTKSSLCGERQTITHLFVTCPNVQVFWVDFELWWNNKNNYSIKLSKNEILYGVTEKLPLRLGLNLCIIIAKYYIHTECCKE